MRTTKVKIAIRSPELYETYFNNPQVDAARELHPKPLWKCKDEWWNGPARKPNYTGEASWKNNTMLQSPTFVACPSTRNWVEKTIVVPLTVDLEVTKTPSGVEFARNGHPHFLYVTHHSPEEYAMYTKKYTNVKFGLPYDILTKELILEGPPHLHKHYFHLPFRTAHGLIQCPGVFSCMVNTFWEDDYIYKKLDDEQSSIFLPAGTPLAYITFPNIKGKIDVEFVEAPNNDPMLWWKSAKNLFRLK